jgi:hypothetical protein
MRLRSGEELLSMEDCTTCYKIICKQCGWEARDCDVLAIQKGEMTTCPDCGWQPGEPIL